MSRILDVLGIDNRELFFMNKANLFHNGDSSPFALLEIGNGTTHLRVNSGEFVDGAASLLLGKYEK